MKKRRKVVGADRQENALSSGDAGGGDTEDATAAAGQCALKWPPEANEEVNGEKLHGIL